MLFINERKRKYYDIFISHAWSYSERYLGVVKLLDNVKYFKYRNYSVPKHDPADANNDAKLKKILNEQIRQANVVVIISGMYINHKKWIKYEMEEAKRQGKKILGVKRRGEKKTPELVKYYSDKLVGWNGDSIAKGIRELSNQ